jgi:hypothetical protein
MNQASTIFTIILEIVSGLVGERGINFAKTTSYTAEFPVVTLGTLPI